MSLPAAGGPYAHQYNGAVVVCVKPEVRGGGMYSGMPRMIHTSPAVRQRQPGRESIESAPRAEDYRCLHSLSVAKIHDLHCLARFMGVERVTVRL